MGAHRELVWKPQAAARWILGADGIGCAVAGVAPAIRTPVGAVVESEVGSKWPIVCALAATSVLLGTGAQEHVPSERALRRAALVNAGWVAMCVAARAQRPRRAAVAVFAATAVSDAVVGAAQWTLGSGRPAHVVA
ncbi:hypothetical protein [Rhodococcus sp. IEGM 1408]|uniref:hypothetical protein n=1 Tax=Rhodococcus sp. IEGM 1408 TaxID=3082220 RepID=UPI0029537780|nr:hypothetical protein [Rhodococcus sp. IEGM 1408]MDV8000646.1 hypothetical protein [Rhodococcus sp. IEGM 1408]